MGRWGVPGRFPRWRPGGASLARSGRRGGKRWGVGLFACAAPWLRMAGGQPDRPLGFTQPSGRVGSMLLKNSFFALGGEAGWNRDLSESSTIDDLVSVDSLGIP